MRYAFTLNGRTHHVTLEEHADGAKFRVEGETFEPAVEKLGRGRYKATIGDKSFEFELTSGRIEDKNGPIDVQIGRARPKLARAGGKGRKGDGRIKPPMPGKVVETHVKEGDEVTEGQVIVILEAMKMQNDLKAPFAGVVSKVHVSEGQNVEATTVLLEIEPIAEGEAAS